MPKILDRLITQLIQRWYDEEVAWKIATKSLQRSGNLRPWTQQATEKWEMRWEMSPEEREITRNRDKKKNKIKKRGMPKIKF
jgi:hypothetical protein